MVTRIIVSVAAVLALSAGVAYAATELTSSDGTQVCVNNTNGLLRVASTCREGEYPLTIGGGGAGDVQVTQNGAFSVAWDATSAGKTLPLTGVTVAGKCELSTYPGYPDVGLARLLVTTSGSMTAFTQNYPNDSGTIGGTSLQTIPASTASGTGIQYSTGPPIIVTSNGATATITFGAQVNAPAQTCTYLWQAVEAPN